MPQVKKINALTERFIAIHKHLKDIGELPDIKTLAAIMGYKSYSIISDILARRANIRQDALDKFIAHFKEYIPDTTLPDTGLLLISQADLKRLITECVNDALKQFMMKAAS
jgi:uncharacterized protein YPO0396